LVLFSTAHPLASLPLTAGVPADASGLKSDTLSVGHLTAGLAKGDEAAFREFHARYFNRLYRFLLVVCRGQQDEAAEAVQLTFLRVVRYARQFDSEEVFWSWLTSLARSSARDAGRKNQRYAALLQRFTSFWWQPASESPAAEDSRLYELVEETLSELSVEEKRLVTGKYLNGESIQELSSFTGLSEKAVESKLFRLRRSLRDRLLEKLRTP
jgi:RNA polymerase sigma factor (sigma-70 family)